MYRIGKTFNFEASHQLPNLPPDHPCGRHHGHSYTIELQLAHPYLPPDQPVPWLKDFRDLDRFKQWVDAYLDHRHLNESLPEIVPTSEALAQFILYKASELLGVSCRREAASGLHLRYAKVSETAKTYAIYSEVE